VVDAAKLFTCHGKPDFWAGGEGECGLASHPTHNASFRGEFSLAAKLSQQRHSSEGQALL